MMKRTFSAIIAAAVALTSIGQTIVVHPKSGEAVTFNASEIDYVEFLPGESVEEPAGEVTITELYCHKGDSQIYGKLYRPSSAEPDTPLPTVILAHSSSLTSDAMKAYATALAADGYCAYAFDFCGACDESRSDGSTEEMTVFTEVDDLKAVITEMKGKAGVDATKMFALGSSQGGLVAALTAEDAEMGLSGLILFYPAFNIPDMIAMMDKFGSFGSSLGSGYSENFCNAMRGYDVYANIGTFGRPVSIIHGSDDIIVKISYSEKAVEKYPNAVLHTIEGANHGFNADNLGSFGSIMGGSTDYDSQVIPLVLEYMHANAPLK